MSALLFAELPRSRPRNRLMHVIDAGVDMILVKCGHCGYSPGWQPWACGHEVAKYKRGVPCPECNAPSAQPPAQGDRHDG